MGNSGWRTCRESRDPFPTLPPWWSFLISCAWAKHRPPTKIKDVRPVYPPPAGGPSAGIVTVEARIGPTGGSKTPGFSRSSPLLDEVAVDAARQWEFTLTLLNGSPVVVDDRDCEFHTGSAAHGLCMTIGHGHHDRDQFLLCSGSSVPCSMPRFTKRSRPMLAPLRRPCWSFWRRASPPASAHGLGGLTPANVTFISIVALLAWAAWALVILLAIARSSHARSRRRGGCRPASANDRFRGHAGPAPGVPGVIPGVTIPVFAIAVCLDAVRDDHRESARRSTTRARLARFVPSVCWDGRWPSSRWPSFLGLFFGPAVS